MSWIAGTGLTAFGRHEGCGTLDLMAIAAHEALDNAGLMRADIDGLICGYATTMPHIMLATVFAEHFGLQPCYAHGIQVGGATGFACVMLAHELADANVARNVLVVAGENRLTGQSRDAAVQALAQVGHPRYEVPLGPIIPTYYGLIAARYAYEFGASEQDLAELAVLMRRNAANHPGAQFKKPITVGDVMLSKPIASPLKLLDCCAVADGAAAVVISNDPARGRVRITGAGQAHLFQHVSAAPDVSHFGAYAAMERARAKARVDLTAVDYLAIYDSFTITLAILLEELGMAPRGQAGAMARNGHFDPGGSQPLNTHGGLLSYGHCGVAGALAHLVECVIQMEGKAGVRQLARHPNLALLHGDGGVLSSHVSLFLELGQ